MSQVELVRQLALRNEALRRLAERNELADKLDHWPTFLQTLQLNVDSGPPGQAFYDTRKNSPHEQFHDALIDHSISSLGAFMPRGTGKTISVLLPWIVDEIRKDPEITFLVGSETLKLAIDQKTMWIRSKLELLEELGIGKYRSKHWTTGAFTVLRPSGIGGQPTVQAWAPDSTGTGRHWINGVFDDLYGEETAGSPSQQEETTKKFIRIHGQKMPGSRIIVVGTLWPGRKTWYWRMLQDPKIKKYYHILCFEERTEHGDIIFKSLTKKFLEEQKATMGKALYDSQYKNRLVDADELAFEATDFKVGEPPEGVELATYMVTDSAYSVSGLKHSSMSAIFIVQKTPDNVAYVMDGDMGRWSAEVFPQKLLDMYERWRDYGSPPSYYTMEGQGPGGVYGAAIELAAKLRGIEPPIKYPISHAKQNKNHRISLSRAPIQDGRIIFSATLPPEVFRMDDGGEPRGYLGNAYMQFAYEGKGLYDGPDAIADIHGVDRQRAPFCPPPGRIDEKKPDTLYQRKLREFRKTNRKSPLWMR